jgi:hypothetical protein
MVENHSKTRMSKPEFPTRVEARAGRTMSPAEIFDVANRREKGLSRLLVAYISTGLVFMLLPGTFLGVWNLISISSRRASEGVSPAWIQAHGHAQVFGWIGSFILGIGFYSIPKLRRLEPFALGLAWICWAMWTIAVALRWTANVYGTYWRALLPFSTTLELAALALFFRAVSTHRMQSGETIDQRWVMIVMAGTAGLVGALGMNLFESVRLALSGSGPAFPPEFDQRLLAVVTWGLHGSVRLGFQHEMVASIPWVEADEDPPDAFGNRTEHGRCHLCNCGSCSCRSSDLDRGIGGGCDCTPDLPEIGATSQDKGRASNLSSIRSHCLRLVVGRGRTRRLGLAAERSDRNLGGFAARTDGWFYCNDGFLRGATRTAGIRGHEIFVEPVIDVYCYIAACSGLFSARQLRGTGVPRLRVVGLERIADLSGHRIGRRHRIAANISVSFARRSSAQSVVHVSAKQSV